MNAIPALQVLDCFISVLDTNYGHGSVTLLNEQLAVSPFLPDWIKVEIFLDKLLQQLQHTPHPAHRDHKMVRPCTASRPNKAELCIKKQHSEGRSFSNDGSCSC